MFQQVGCRGCRWGGTCAASYLGRSSAPWCSGWGHWRVVTARGGRALSGRSPCGTGRSLGGLYRDKTVAGAGQAFGRFVRRTPWPGHGPHQAHTALRAACCVLRAPMARLPPTRQHANTPTRQHANTPTRPQHGKLLRRGAVESRIRPVAGNALRHGLGGCRTLSPGAPGSVHPSAARHAVVEWSPVPCGQSPRVLRPQAHRLPSPPAGC